MIRRALTVVVAVAGCASITVGAALVFVPAGWVVGGFFALAAALLYDPDRKVAQ